MLIKSHKSNCITSCNYVDQNRVYASDSRTVEVINIFFFPFVLHRAIIELAAIGNITIKIIKFYQNYQRAKSSAEPIRVIHIKQQKQTCVYNSAFRHTSRHLTDPTVSTPSYFHLLHPTYSGRHPFCDGNLE